MWIFIIWRDSGQGTFSTRYKPRLTRGMPRGTNVACDWIRAPRSLPWTRFLDFDISVCFVYRTDIGSALSCRAIRLWNNARLWLRSKSQSFPHLPWPANLLALSHICLFTFSLVHYDPRFEMSIPWFCSDSSPRVDENMYRLYWGRIWEVPCKNCSCPDWPHGRVFKHPPFTSKQTKSDIMPLIQRSNLSYDSGRFGPWHSVNRASKSVETEYRLKAERLTVLESPLRYKNNCC
jgi:hypothetical protein